MQGACTRTYQFNVYFLQYLVRVAFTSHEDQVLQGVW